MFNTFNKLSQILIQILLTTENTKFTKKRREKNVYYVMIQQKQKILHYNDLYAQNRKK